MRIYSHNLEELITLCEQLGILFLLNSACRYIEIYNESDIYKLENQLCEGALC